MALLGLGRFLASAGFNDGMELRRAFGPPRGASFAAGVAVGFGSLALVLAGGLLAGERFWRIGITGSGLAGHVLTALGSALVVAMIEEILFRWALYGALRKVYAKGFAMLLSASIYAIVHFFSRTEASLPITGWSGLALLPRMLRGFGDLHALIPAFINLVVVGSILAMAYERTGRLWLSIGLHGGWIFWLKSTGYLTLRQEGGGGWFWGGEKMIDGWAALIVLVVSYYSVNVVLKRGQERKI